MRVQSLVRGDQAALLLNLKGAGGGMCWWCGVIFFIRKTPISQNNFCPAVCTSAKMNVPSWNFWKPKQCMAHLLSCKQRSGPRYFWKFPSVCNSLCQYKLFFSSHCLFHIPTHLEFMTWECPMAPRRASKGRHVTQGSRAGSLPGLTNSSDLCKSERAFSALSENSIC